MNIDLADCVAIVGMSGRFPGARDVNEFWQNLRDGVESIRSFSDEELLGAGVDPSLLADPLFVKSKPILDNIELFDAEFFDCTPAEGEIMDPQHRLFLECAWEALEQAGCDVERHADWIGVYGGVSSPSYAINNLARVNHPGGMALAIATMPDYVATRVSYKLNLRGPSITVQTACSTSLVAVHMACRSLIDYECNVALAGGSSIDLARGYLFETGGPASPDGHCRAFDVNANGTVFGDGVGVVALKRLEDALADGDTIYAIIRGSAINNDGAMKVGYTAPSIEGQARVILQAQRQADVDPATIRYIEAHGTGTELGDPIEMAALSKAFRVKTSAKQFCAIGSVKTNIGHANAAAGVVGLIKTALSLHHQQIPPTLHFKQANPQIDFADSPFYINTKLTDWLAIDGIPRRAGVSSFGIGGTNAHVILEEAPAYEASDPPRSWQLLTLSAKTDISLKKVVANLEEYLRCHAQANLADIAFTLQTGRRRFNRRCIVVCRDHDDALNVLENRDPTRIATFAQEQSAVTVAFLFPGQGSQYIAMGSTLYKEEPIFRKHVDYCAELLRPLLGLDLRGVIHPPEGDGSVGEEELNQTWLTQPALFVVEYALAQLWIAWGVRPTAMVGHSVGEYVAACLAGVFSLDDALKLVAARGRVMQEMPRGAMLAVPLSEKELLPLLNDYLSLAAVNAPARCVVAGSIKAIATLEEELRRRNIETRLLSTSHAFHSPMMEPALASFLEEVRKIKLSTPTIPFISSKSGNWVDADQIVKAEYWGQQLRQTVRFADGVQELAKTSGQIFLEVGPGHTLGALVRQQVTNKSTTVLASLRYSKDRVSSEMAFLLETLGRLWLAGVDIDWSNMHAGARRRRLPLPTYPFQRERYWIGPGDLQAQGNTAPIQNVPHNEINELPNSINSAEFSSFRTIHGRPTLNSLYVAPTTDTEKKLAEIWQNLLGINRIGRHDDYLELGGDSLLAVQILSSILKTFGVDISMRNFFESPTIAGTAAKIDAVPLASISFVVPTIRARPRPERLPLSFAQQRLWFLDQLQPNNSSYNIPCATRLEGMLDVNIVQQALNAIEQRHESMRTYFPVLDGECVQQIRPMQPVVLPLIDLTELPFEQREARARALIADEATDPFDLAMGPLWRAKLVRVGDRNHILLFTLHHIISDDWSLRIIQREFVDLYKAFSQQHPSPLVPLPLQYADFTLWQHEYLQGKVLEGQTQYWKRQLSGAPTLLELPTDSPRPAVQTYAGKVLPYGLGRSLSERIFAMSQQEGVTLYMILLSAFGILLSRYSGQRDIIIGSPVANRHHAGLEPIVGFFANTLALRLRLYSNRSFKELLNQVRTTALDAYSHQDLPFEKLVDEMKVPRSLSYSPLAQVALVIHNNNEMFDLIIESGKKKFSEEIYITSLDSEVGASKRDLTVHVNRLSDNIVGGIEYNADLFDHTTIERMREQFIYLLEQIAIDPDKKLNELSLLSAEEADKILTKWSGTLPSFPKRGCVHKRFEAQAARTPHAVALLWEGTALTYEELNSYSNTLAHRLRGFGVTPDTLVGLCAERSFDMVIGMLAVLKAGGAYLPLDPTYPAERLKRMLADAQPVLLLTQPHLLERLSAVHVDGLHLDACLDRLSLQGTQFHNTNPDFFVLPQHLAYVIYTSGSSGTPKGACITHENIYSYIQSLGDNFELAVDDRYLHTASFSFSSSMRQLWLPLCHGAKVVLAGDAQIRDVDRFRDLILNERPTVVDLTPSYYSLLNATEDSGVASMFPDAHTFLSASEPLPFSLFKTLVGGVGRRVVNMFGQTETCGIVSTFPASERLDSDERVEGTHGNVLIGRPLPHVKIYILDERMDLVPVGVPGQLHVGTVTLGRGYWARPDLTAGAFVPNPFSNGERLYRTGVLARYLADGNIDCLGREDHQVKLRGIRIELGEIEAALRSLPFVRESAVVLHKDASGDESLVAYLSPKPEHYQSVTVRDALSQMLPDFMLPAQFIFLDRLPLSPNGKVDRTALPEPDYSSPRIRQSEPPRGVVEHALAAIWSDVLHCESVGRNDHFFEVGGHSLRAITMLAAVRQRLQVSLPLASVFSHPTIAEQALLISKDVDLSLSLLVPLKVSAELPAVFCIHSLDGLVFNYQALADCLANHFSVYGIQSPESAGLPSCKSIDALVGDYVKCIETVHPSGPYHLVGWSAGSIIAFAIAAALEAKGKGVKYLGLVDTNISAFIPLIDVGIDEVKRQAARVAFNLFDETAATKEILHEINARLRQMSIVDFLNDDQECAKFLSPFTEKRALKASRETLEIVKRQIFSTYHNFMLLAGFVPSKLRTPLHLCFPANSPQDDRVQRVDWSNLVDTQNFPTQDIVVGDHFSILTKPDVVPLARCILAFHGILVDDA